MSDKPRHILIIEHDRDLGQLLQSILSHEGYEASWMLQSPDVLTEVRQSNPDVLLLDVLSYRARDELATLDMLRTDPQAGRIPVVAMTTAAPLTEELVASYNIRATLVKPFELEELVHKVRQAADQPPLHASIPVDTNPEGVLAKVERILAERSREALFRWVQRLRQHAPWKGRDDLQMSDLLDHVPVLVEAIDVALIVGSDRFFREHPEATERVRLHTTLRRSQGFSLGSLLKEYALLRDELWKLLGENLPQEMDRQDVLIMARAIDGSLDRIIEITIPAYLEDEQEKAA